MAANNWAHVRLSVQMHPRSRAGFPMCLDWRLEAKAPGDEWSLRSTVAFGSEKIDGLVWPVSRDDMLAAMVEVLMGVRWESPDGPPF